MKTADQGQPITDQCWGVLDSSSNLVGGSPPQGRGCRVVSWQEKGGATAWVTWGLPSFLSEHRALGGWPGNPAASLGPLGRPCALEGLPGGAVIPQSISVHCLGPGIRDRMAVSGLLSPRGNRAGVQAHGCEVAGRCGLPLERHWGGSLRKGRQDAGIRRHGGPQDGNSGPLVHRGRHEGQGSPLSVK